MKSMRIAVVERSQLADILRGVGAAGAAATDISDGEVSKPFRAGSVGVGYYDWEITKLPHFIVVQESERRDFFAWVNTYCPFVTPLSQWCRVVTERELTDAGAARVPPRYGGAVAAWAGAMIGEAILHMGTGGKVAQLPIAALHTCGTFVAARSFGLWEDPDSRIAATERFRGARALLGSTERGVRAADLARAWEVLEILSGWKDRVRQGGLWEENWTVAACEDIQRTGFVGKGTMTKVVERLGWSGDYLEFEKAGAEQRLRIFDGAVERLGRMRESGESVETLAAFTVGYFAARIGGGATGHIGLLDGIVGRRPMVAVWYGVASALYRPEVWGAEFGGLGRLAVRELALPWRFCDPPRCDVAVDELASLVEPRRRSASLRFRGAMRKMVNVEVALGVNGAIRLPWAAEDDGEGVVGQAFQAELAELNRHLTAATESARRLNEGCGGSAGGKSGARKRTRRARAGEKRGRAREEES